MTDPIAFPSTTPNIGLPLLFAGQSQKEFFVNQALVILDALAHGTVIASLPQPPATSSDGDCYRISSLATGDWSGRADQIAIRIGGSWHFADPAEGMILFDRAASRWIWFRSGWQSALAPSLPAGGAVIDVEARALLATLVQSLQSVGLLAPPSA
jgi:Protein of unknown function (DUF2793)